MNPLSCKIAKDLASPPSREPRKPAKVKSARDLSPAVPQDSDGINWGKVLSAAGLASSSLMGMASTAQAQVAPVAQVTQQEVRAPISLRRESAQTAVKTALTTTPAPIAAATSTSFKAQRMEALEHLDQQGVAGSKEPGLFKPSPILGKYWLTEIDAGEAVQRLDSQATIYLKDAQGNKVAVSDDQTLAKIDALVGRQLGDNGLPSQRIADLKQIQGQLKIDNFQAYQRLDAKTVTKTKDGVELQSFQDLRLLAELKSENPTPRARALNRWKDQFTAKGEKLDAVTVGRRLRKGEPVQFQHKDFSIELKSAKDLELAEALYGEDTEQVLGTSTRQLLLELEGEQDMWVEGDTHALLDYIGDWHYDRYRSNERYLREQFLEGRYTEQRNLRAERDFIEAFAYRDVKIPEQILPRPVSALEGYRMVQNPSGEGLYAGGQRVRDLTSLAEKHAFDRGRSHEVVGQENSALLERLFPRKQYQVYQDLSSGGSVLYKTYDFTTGGDLYASVSSLDELQNLSQMIDNQREFDRYQLPMETVQKRSKALVRSVGPQMKRSLSSAESRKNSEESALSRAYSLPTTKTETYTETKRELVYEHFSCNGSKPMYKMPDIRDSWGMEACYKDVEYTRERTVNNDERDSEISSAQSGIRQAKRNIEAAKKALAQFPEIQKKVESLEKSSDATEILELLDKLDFPSAELSELKSLLHTLKRPARPEGWVPPAPRFPGSL